MYLRLLGALLLCAFATSAWASGYSEFDAGIASARLKDFDSAQAHMTAALAAPDLDPSFRAPAHVIRAEVFVQRRQWQNAIDETSAALAANPQYWIAYDLRAFCHEQFGQDDPAIADLTALINAKPFFPGLFSRRGGIYLRLKRYSEATADFNVIVTMQPNDAFSYITRGDAFRRMGDFAHALDDMNKAVDMATRVWQAYLNRGLVYQDKGDYADAASDLANAARIAPGVVVITLDRGIVAWESGDFPSAVKFFQDVRDSSSDQYRPTGAIWAALATLSSGGSDADAAKAAVSSFDRKQWPGPIVDLYAGNSSVDALTKIAATSDVQSPPYRVCEAEFYTGEWFVLHHNPAQGKPLLQRAAADCTGDLIERSAAIVAYQHLP